MLWIFLLQASSMYEKLVQSTLHSNPKLLCKYALGFTSVSFLDVRKARPEYFTPYSMLLCKYALVLLLQAFSMHKKLAQSTLLLTSSYYQYVCMLKVLCRLLLQACSMYEKFAQGTLHPTPCYYVSMLWVLLM